MDFRVAGLTNDQCLSAHSALSLASAVPTFLVAEDLAAGRLVELLPEYRSITLGIYAIYPTRKHVALKVRALIDFLPQQLSASPSF